VDTPKSAVLLDPEGRRFVQAGPDERKAIWRAQLLKLSLFSEIAAVLRKQRKHVIDRDFVLETIVLRMPQENYEKVFETFVGWARFGELFAYDEKTGMMSRYERRRSSATAAVVESPEAPPPPPPPQ
jgi:NitT/TauT family transport system ATP-binding protein